VDFLSQRAEPTAGTFIPSRGIKTEVATWSLKAHKCVSHGVRERSAQGQNPIFNWQTSALRCTAVLHHENCTAYGGERVKYYVFPVHAINHKCDVEAKLHSFWTLSARSTSYYYSFIPGQEPGRHETRGLVGPTAGLGVLKKIKSFSSLPRFETRTVKSVA